MSVDPSRYPIQIRVVQGFIEVSQPDFDIYRMKGKFADIKRKEEIGAAVLDVWEEVVKRAKEGAPIPQVPMSPKQAALDSVTKWVTVDEAAALLQVTPASIRRWCAKGKLKFKKTAGGHRRILFDDIKNLNTFKQNKTPELECSNSESRG